MRREGVCGAGREEGPRENRVYNVEGGNNGCRPHDQPHDLNSPPPLSKVGTPVRRRPLNCAAERRHTWFYLNHPRSVVRNER